MAVLGLEQLSNSRAQTQARASTGNPVYNAGTNNATAGRTPRSVSDLSQRTPTGGTLRHPTPVGEITPYDPDRIETPKDQSPVPQAPISLTSPVGSYFDPLIAAAERRLQEQQGQITADYTRAKSQAEQEHLYTQNQAERQHQQALKYLQDQLASQGILRSGINIAEQGRMGEEYQDVQFRLDSMLQNQLNSLLSNYNQGMQQTYTGLEGLMGQKALAEAQWQMQEAQKIAEAEARQKHLEDLDRLVRITQPTVSSTGKIHPTTTVKGDLAYEKDLESATQRVADIFKHRGVDVGFEMNKTGDESEQARLQRIAQEILDGKRDWGQVRTSVASLGKRQADALRQELGLVNF